ncbi:MULTISPECIES: FtsX-like permease family protein [unclassified Micromonospora]|uniref:FtsX-like permease family protein n=1 Tax=unclassified Micromonospora TaxID=2617518 RepID=UPI0036301FCC
MLAVLGHRSSRDGGVTALTHRVALAAATVVALLSGWLFIAADAVFTARDARIVSREPVFLDRADTRPPMAKWAERGDFFRDSQFIVINIVPQRPDAPPPPGLPRWPASGEAFLSPALLAADTDGELQQRYGRLVGEIGADGLAEPAEWLVYLQPADAAWLDRSSAETRISGFGNPQVTALTYRTAGLSGRTAQDMYLLMLLVIGVPTLVLIAVAVRSGAEQRDRRLAMLDALGAPTRAKAWVLAGEAALPVAAGILLGAITAALTTVVDVTVPFVDYRVPADDLAAGRSGLALLTVSTAILMLGLTIVAQLRRRAVQGTRPRAVTARLRTWPRVLFAVAVLLLALATWSAAEAGGVYPNALQMRVFQAAMLVAIFTLPAAVASLAVPVGRFAARTGRRRGWPAATIGGRWLIDRSAAIARMCAAIVVGLAVLTFLQVYLNQALDAGTWSTQRQLLGDRIVTVRANNPAIEADKFTATLGTDRTVRVATDKNNNQALVGTCEALAHLGTLTTCAAAPTPAPDAYRTFNTTGNAIRSGAASTIIWTDPLVGPTVPPDYQIVGFLVFNDDGHPGVQAIARTAYAMLAFPDVHTSGQYSISGAVDQAHLYSWVWAFGLLGVLVLALTTTIGAVDTFLLQTRSLGPLGAMYTRRRLYAIIAQWNITVPLVFAGLAGGAAAAALGHAFSLTRGFGRLSWPLLTGSVLAVVVIAVSLGLLCGETATRAVRRWRPTAD